MFSNKVAFIDGHLLQEGWKLDIKCLNAGCKKGKHEKLLQAMSCLLPAQSKDKERERKRKYAAKKRKLQPFFDELKIAEAQYETFENIRKDVMDELESNLPEGIGRNLRNQLAAHFQKFFDEKKLDVKGEVDTAKAKLAMESTSFEATIIASDLETSEEEDAGETEETEEAEEAQSSSQPEEESDTRKRTKKRAPLADRVTRSKKSRK